MRRSLVDKPSKNSFQYKKLTKNNPATAQLLKSLEVSQCKKGNPFLSNVEHGSTLHMRSGNGTGSKEDGSNNEQTFQQRIKSAHAYPSKRPRQMKKGVHEIHDPSHSDDQEAGSHSINLVMKSQHTKVVKNSPVSTVFQKFLIQDGQSISQVSLGANRQPVMRHADSVQSSEAGMIALEEESSQQQIVKPTMVAKTVKSPEKSLFINVQPLSKNQLQAGSPQFEGRHDRSKMSSSKSSKQAEMNSKSQTEEEKQNSDKNIQTGTFAEEVGTQTAGLNLKTQTSFVAYDAEDQVQSMEEFLNFYNNTDLFKLGTSDSQQITGVGRQSRSLQSIAEGQEFKFDKSKVVALVPSDGMILGQRQIDRSLATRGYNSRRYVCLYLRDLVQYHNQIVSQLIKRRRATQCGRITQNGRQERERRFTPNPQLMRNSNLAPSCFKRLEGNTLKKLDFEKEFFSTNLLFMQELIQKGQHLICQAPDKPIISTKNILKNPNKEILEIQKLIKQAREKLDDQVRLKRDQNNVSGHDFYADLVSQQSQLYETQVSEQTLQLNGMFNQHHVTPPSRSQRTLHIQQCPESEQYPPTITMSQAMVATETQNSVLGSDRQPQNLSIVTKFAEKKPQKEAQWHGTRFDNRYGHKAKSIAHKNQKIRQAQKQYMKKNMQSVLVVGQVGKKQSMQKPLVTDSSLVQDVNLNEQSFQATLPRRQNTTERTNIEADLERQPNCDASNKLKMTAVLLEDYRTFMQGGGSYKKSALKKDDPYDQDHSQGDKSNNSNLLALCEVDATSEQKMQASLYKEFKIMKNYALANVDGTKEANEKRQRTMSAQPFNLFQVNESTSTNLQLLHKRCAMQRLSLDQQQKIKESGYAAVIPITLRDPYKPHEPTRQHPRWIPTSKKVKAQISRAESVEPICNQDRLSQDHLYRTTRSTQALFNSVSDEAGQKNESLVIDHRNTINLQKVIDQYYDGELPLENGDLLSMKIVQNISGKHENKEPLDISAQKQSILTRAKSRSSEKNKLQGTKFRQSEMQGFRRVNNSSSRKARDKTEDKEADKKSFNHQLQDEDKTSVMVESRGAQNLTGIQTTAKQDQKSKKSQEREVEQSSGGFSTQILTRRLKSPIGEDSRQNNNDDINQVIVDTSTQTLFKQSSTKSLKKSSTSDRAEHDYPKKCNNVSARSSKLNIQELSKEQSSQDFGISGEQIKERARHHPYGSSKAIKHRQATSNSKKQQNSAISKDKQRKKVNKKSKANSSNSNNSSAELRTLSRGGESQNLSNSMDQSNKSPERYLENMQSLVNQAYDQTFNDQQINQESQMLLVNQDSVTSQSDQWVKIPKSQTNQNQQKKIDREINNQEKLIPCKKYSAIMSQKSNVRALLSVSKQILESDGSEHDVTIQSEKQGSSVDQTSPGREKLQFLATAIYEKDQTLPQQENFDDLMAESRSRSMSELANRPEVKGFKKNDRFQKDRISSNEKSPFSNQKTEQGAIGSKLNSIVSQKSKIQSNLTSERLEKPNGKSTTYRQADDNMLPIVSCDNNNFNTMAQETFGVDVKTEPGDGNIYNEKSKSKIIAKASASNYSQQPDFKLLETEDRKIENEHDDIELRKSPIRVETTAFSKANELASQKSVIKESKSLEKGSIENEKMRPNTTSIGHRIALPMSKIPLAPENYTKSMSRVPESVNQKQILVLNKDVHSEQRCATVYPYADYLRNVDLSQVISNSRNSDPLQKGNQLGSRAQTVLQNTVNCGKKSGKNQSFTSEQTRPKTSMHSFNSVSRDIRLARDERNNSQLLKRNISINRRKQQILLKGQLERQKRIEKLSNISRNDGQKPTQIIPVHAKKRVPTPNEDENQMRMVYSSMGRSESLNLTAQSSQLQHGIDIPVKTMFGSNMETLEQDTCEKQRFKQKSHNLCSEHVKTQQRKKIYNGGEGVSKSMAGLTDPAIFLQNTQDISDSHRFHTRTNTQAMIYVDQNISPGMTSSVNMISPKDSQQTQNQVELTTRAFQNLDDLSKVSKVTVTKNLFRQSDTKESSDSMQALHQMQEFLKSQLASDRTADAKNLISTEKDIMIHAAMQGQPAQGVGNEIQRKRERMKMLYRQGRNKHSNLFRFAQKGQYCTVGTSSVERPPTTQTVCQKGRRAASVLLNSSLGINESQDSFSIQGSSIKKQMANAHPYVPQTQHHNHFIRLMKNQK